ncbi:MAG: aspartyl protease family protein [Phenylobacterium sp.]
MSPRSLPAALIACILLLAPARASTALLLVASSDIAFEFVQDRQILFPMWVNGHPAEAWLDTGASATVLDAAFARSIGLQLGEPVRAQGVAGRVSGVRLAVAGLQVGALSMPGRRVGVMDLSAVSRVVQRPVEVILGRDVFDNAVVDIDFQARRIALFPRQTFRPPADLAPLPLTHSGGLRTFPIILGGSAVAAVLDLGNGGAILADGDVAAAEALLAGRPVSTVQTVGADGPRLGTIATVDAVRVGGVRFDGVPITLTRGLSSQDPTNVGLAILSRFHMTIDFAGDRLWLRPYPGAAEAPFRKNRAGLSMTPAGDRLRITHVAVGSPAQAGGWQVGEAVIAIDGHPIDAGFSASELSRWHFGPAGQVVELMMADGTRRRLTLADYY